MYLIWLLIQINKLFFFKADICEAIGNLNTA